MADIARRTYARNDTGPRAVDTRVSRRTSDTQQRCHSSGVSFVLESLGSMLPSKMQTDARISLQFAVSARTPGQMRHVNPQALVAVASLVDDRTSAPTPAGYIAPATGSARSRLVQTIAPTFDVSFEQLVVKQPGKFRLKVTLLRMPEASAAGGQATHVAEWESDTIRVQALANGAS
ncbi:hypothetical protein AAFC00_000813 [Neodothiora populina]|uniref:Velvet domain-containing protein n=1 Tax=Neodothiora populina TaxID=2781224 RepID=A0ABR3PLV5_9PEZI